MATACVALLHKVIFPVFFAILVARRRHVILGEKVIIGMLLLPLLLLPLLGLSKLLLLLYFFVSSRTICGVRENTLPAAASTPGPFFVTRADDPPSPASGRASSRPLSC